ncbi:uncharacterized protein LOC111946946 isoform X2 [Oryzias latipes]
MQPHKPGAGTPSRTKRVAEQQKHGSGHRGQGVEGRLSHRQRANFQNSEDPPVHKTLSAPELHAKCPNNTERLSSCLEQRRFRGDDRMISWKRLQS